MSCSVRVKSLRHNDCKHLRQSAVLSDTHSTYPNRNRDVDGYTATGSLYHVRGHNLVPAIQRITEQSPPFGKNHNNMSLIHVKNSSKQNASYLKHYNLESSNALDRLNIVNHQPASNSKDPTLQANVRPQDILGDKFPHSNLIEEKCLPKHDTRSKDWAPKLLNRHLDSGEHICSKMFKNSQRKKNKTELIYEFCDHNMCRHCARCCRVTKKYHTSPLNGREQHLTQSTSSLVSLSRHVSQFHDKTDAFENNLFSFDDSQFVGSYRPEVAPTWKYRKCGCYGDYMHKGHDNSSTYLVIRENETDVPINLPRLILNSQHAAVAFNMFRNIRSQYKHIVLPNSPHSSAYTHECLTQSVAQILNRIIHGTFLTSLFDYLPHNYVHSFRYYQRRLTNFLCIILQHMKQLWAVHRAILQDVFKHVANVAETSHKFDKVTEGNYPHKCHKCVKGRTRRQEQQLTLSRDQNKCSNCKSDMYEKINNKHTTNEQRRVTYRQCSIARHFRSNEHSFSFRELPENKVRRNLNSSCKRNHNDADGNSTPHASHKFSSSNSPLKCHSMGQESHNETTAIDVCNYEPIQAPRERRQSYPRLKSLNFDFCTVNQQRLQISDECNESLTQSYNGSVDETESDKIDISQFRPGTRIRQCNYVTNSRVQQGTSTFIRDNNSTKNNTAGGGPYRHERRRKLKKGNWHIIDVGDINAGVHFNHKSPATMNKMKYKKHKRNYVSETYTPSSGTYRPSGGCHTVIRPILSRRSTERDDNATHLNTKHDKSCVSRNSVSKLLIRHSDTEKQVSENRGLKNVYDLKQASSYRLLAPHDNIVGRASYSPQSCINQKTNKSSVGKKTAIKPRLLDLQPMGDNDKQTVRYSTSTQKREPRLCSIRVGCMPVNLMPVATSSPLFTDYGDKPHKYINTHSSGQQYPSTSSSSNYIPSYKFHNPTKPIQYNNSSSSESSVIEEARRRKRYLNENIKKHEDTEINKLKAEMRPSIHKSNHERQQSWAVEKQTHYSPKQINKTLKDSQKLIPSSFGVNQLGRKHVFKEHLPQDKNHKERNVFGASCRSLSPENKSFRTDTHCSNGSTDETYLSLDNDLIILKHKKNDNDESSGRSTRTKTISGDSLYLAQVLSSRTTQIFYSDSHSLQGSVTDIQEYNNIYNTLQPSTCICCTDEHYCQPSNAQFHKPSCPKFRSRPRVSRNRTRRERSQQLIFSSEDDTHLCQQDTGPVSCWHGPKSCTSSSINSAENEISGLSDLKKVSASSQRKCQIRFKNTPVGPYNEKVEGNSRKDIMGASAHMKKTYERYIKNPFTCIDNEGLNSSLESQIHLTENSNTYEESLFLPKGKKVKKRKRGSKCKLLRASSNNPTMQRQSHSRGQLKSRNGNETYQNVVTHSDRRLKNKDDLSPHSILFDGEYISYMKMIPKEGLCRGFRLSKMDASGVSKIISTKPSATETTLKSNIIHKKLSHVHNAGNSVNSLLSSESMKYMSPTTSSLKVTATTDTDCSHSSDKKTVISKSSQTSRKIIRKTSVTTRDVNNILQKPKTQSKSTQLPHATIKASNTTGCHQEKQFHFSRGSAKLETKNASTMFPQFNNYDGKKSARPATIKRNTTSGESTNSDAVHIARLYCNPHKNTKNVETVTDKTSLLCVGCQCCQLKHAPAVTSSDNHISCEIREEIAEKDTQTCLLKDMNNKTCFNIIQDAANVTDNTGLLCAGCTCNQIKHTHSVILSDKHISCDMREEFPEKDTQTHLLKDMKCEACCNSRKDVATITDNTVLLCGGCTCNQIQNAPCVISSDKHISCDIREKYPEKDTQTCPLKEMKYGTCFNKITCSNSVSKIDNIHTVPESSQVCLEELVNINLLSEIVQIPKNDDIITRLEKTPDQHSASRLSTMKPIINFDRRKIKKNNTKRCLLKKYKKQTDTGLIFKLQFNSKPNRTSSMKFEKSYNAKNNSVVQIHDLIRAMNIMGIQSETCLEDAVCETKSQTIQTVAIDNNNISENSTKLKSTQTNINCKQNITKVPQEHEFLTDHKNQKQVQFEGCPLTITNFTKEKWHSQKVDVPSDQQNSQKNVEKSIPSGAPPLPHRDSKYPMFNSHRPMYSMIPITPDSSKRVNSSTVHLNKHINRQACTNSQPIKARQRTASQQEGQSRSTVTRLMNASSESMEPSPYRGNYKHSPTDAYQIAIANCDNCHTSLTRCLSVGNNQTSENKNLPTASKKISEIRNVPAVSNEIPEIINVPAASNQISEIRYLPSVNMLGTRCMSQDIIHTCDISHMPVANNQTSEIVYMPLSNKHASEIRCASTDNTHISENGNQSLTNICTIEPRYMSEVNRGASETKYLLPFYNSHTSETICMLTDANKLASETRYMQPTTNNLTSEIIYMPAPIYQNSTEKASNVLITPNSLFTDSINIKTKIPVPINWKHRKSLLSTIYRRESKRRRGCVMSGIVSRNVSPNCSADFDNQYFNKAVTLISPTYQHLYDTNLKLLKHFNPTLQFVNNVSHHRGPRNSEHSMQSSYGSYSPSNIESDVTSTKISEEHCSENSFLYVTDNREIKLPTSTKTRRRQHEGVH